MSAKNKNTTPPISPKLIGIAAAAVIGVAALVVVTHKQGGPSTHGASGQGGGEGTETSTEQTTTIGGTVGSEDAVTIKNDGPVTIISHSNYVEEQIQPDPALKEPDDNPAYGDPTVYPSILRILEERGTYKFVQDLELETYGKPVQMLTLTATSPAGGIISSTISGRKPSKTEETPERVSLQFSNPRAGSYSPAITSKTKDITITYSLTQ